MKIILIILAIFFPPLACLLVGKIKRFLISIPLTFLFWIPGVIYAIRTVKAARAEQERSEILSTISEERRINNKIVGKAIQHYNSAERNRKAGNIKEAEKKYWKSIEKWRECKESPAPAPFRKLAKLYYHTGFTKKAIEVLGMYLDPSIWPEELLGKDGSVENEEIELLRKRFKEGKFQRLEGKYEEKPTGDYP